MYPNYFNYAAAPPMQPQPGLKGRPVSSLEEARVANVDFDGSLFLFPDVANKRIYTKQINLDGTASMKIYAQVEDTTPAASAFVTKEEFDSTIQSLLSKLNKEENKYESTTSKSSKSESITF